MARPRYTKPDSNQGDIVDGLRRLGAVVWNTSPLGGQVLDLVVFWRGQCRPVEVKAPGGTYTRGEKDGMAALAAVGVEAITATCIEDVLARW